MFTKTIKTTGGPLKISIPEDISEISVGLLMALTPEPGNSFSQLEQLSILSGVPSGKEEREYADDKITLCDIKVSDLEVFDDTLQKIAYQLKAFVTVQDIPEGITIPTDQPNVKRWFGRTTEHKGKYVKVLSNLGIEPAGAYMEAKEVIKADLEEFAKHNPELSDDELKDVYSPTIQSLCRILALYFYCPATGEKFNSYKAVQFEEVIKKLPITKALPIARYFFLRYPNLSREKVRPSVENMKLLRKGQALKI